MHAVNGLHHITAIAGPAQENLDFYAGVLGMRLVKRSVNQDDPGTYHLFYADAEGSPGSDLTFFPWAHMAPPRAGHGLAMEVGLEVPENTLPYWSDRLGRYGTAIGPAETRFGQTVLALTDPHGLRVALVEARSHRQFTPWEDSPIPPERQIRGLHGAQVWERDAAATAQFLTSVLGFERIATVEARGASGPCTISLGASMTRIINGRCERGWKARVLTRRASSIGSGSSRCISKSPVACCSSLRPTDPGSR
jgi:glyoxalase family protein